MDLTYAVKFKGARTPEAYERLIIDVMMGNATNFVRRYDGECLPMYDLIILSLDIPTMAVMNFFRLGESLHLSCTILRKEIRSRSSMFTVLAAW